MGLLSIVISSPYLQIKLHSYTSLSIEDVGHIVQQSTHEPNECGPGAYLSIYFFESLVDFGLQLRILCHIILS